MQSKGSAQKENVWIEMVELLKKDTNDVANNEANNATVNNNNVIKDNEYNKNELVNKDEQNEQVEKKLEKIVVNNKKEEKENFENEKDFDKNQININSINFINDISNDNENNINSITEEDAKKDVKDENPNKIIENDEQENESSSIVKNKEEKFASFEEKEKFFITVLMSNLPCLKEYADGFRNIKKHYDESNKSNFCYHYYISDVVASSKCRSQTDNKNATLIKGNFMVTTECLLNGLVAFNKRYNEIATERNLAKIKETVETKQDIINSLNALLEMMYKRTKDNNGIISLNEVVKYLCTRLYNAGKKVDKEIDKKYKVELDNSELVQFINCEPVTLKSICIAEPCLKDIRHRWTDGYRLKCPIPLGEQEKMVGRRQLPNYYKDENVLTVCDKQKEFSAAALAFVKGNENYCPICAMNLHTCNSNTHEDVDEYHAEGIESTKKRIQEKKNKEPKIVKAYNALDEWSQQAIDDRLLNLNRESKLQIKNAINYVYKVLEMDKKVKTIMTDEANKDLSTLTEHISKKHKNGY